MTRLSNFRVGHIVLYEIVMRPVLFQQNRDDRGPSQRVSRRHIPSSYLPEFTDAR
jgi:hypothetical protein